MVIIQYDLSFRRHQRDNCGPSKIELIAEAADDGIFIVRWKAVSAAHAAHGKLTYAQRDAPEATTATIYAGRRTMRRERISRFRVGLRTVWVDVHVRECWQTEHAAGAARQADRFRKFRIEAAPARSRCFRTD